MSKAIGNDKPNGLLDIELELWRALLKVATGRDTIFPAMQTFFANISQGDILAMSPEDRSFFSLRALLKDCYDQKLTILSGMPGQ
jgi:hypothetical protein